MSKKDNNHTEEEDDEQEYKVTNTHMYTPISLIDTKENKENSDFSRQKILKQNTTEYNGAEKFILWH